MKKTNLLLIAFFCFGTLIGQYPRVPRAAQDSTDRILNATKHRVDSAFEAGYPILRAEALKGRPYIPWASRPTDLPQAKIPAFPGAMGGGAFSFGGRGGKVFVVTSLADSGPGTFREACEAIGARIIVFNVAGIIRLTTPIIVQAPYITIAGQTAPGDGVVIAGESLWINTHDVVIRHMRFRRGETDVTRRDDCIGGNPIGNIMIDHCSVSWGLDENISFYRHTYNDGTGGASKKLGTVNVTIQNTISSQALDTYNHAFGSTLGGENATFLRNLWANNAGRNPSIGWNGVFTFVNNVIYHWVHRSVDGGDHTALYNIINNYYKPGPLTPKNAPVGFRILKPESRASFAGEKIYGRVYASGNIMEGNEAVTRDNWNGGIQVDNLPDAGKFTPWMRWNEPFPMPEFPIMTARAAYEHVLKHVGATIPKRDIVDQRVIEQVRTGKVHYDEAANEIDFYQFPHRRLAKDSYKHGIITDIRQVGGFPTYQGTPYIDSDNDGMPDAWEIKYRLNPRDPSDANGDINGDGYTNIEKYINGINPRRRVDWTNPKNNHDTLARKGKLI